jgi:hypothetical protein
MHADDPKRFAPLNRKPAIRSPPSVGPDGQSEHIARLSDDQKNLLRRR